MLGVLFPFLLLGSATWLGAQDFAAIAKLLDSERVRLKMPGYAAGIYYRGEILWTRAQGLADVRTNRPVRRATPFRLASISKPLTSVGLLQLVEMRKLTLDDEVHKWCAAFPPKKYPIRIGQLLGHLGGIRHYRSSDPEDANNQIHFGSLVESLKKFAADPLVQEPGTKYLYSTYGYSVVGCAMEGASGMSYEDWMRDKVFATVGMCNTGPDDGRGVSMRRAMGYRRGANQEIEDCAVSDNTAKIPGGGYVSTVDDLLRFSEGIFRQQLLKSETIERMWTAGKLRSGTSTGYGLGWSLPNRPAGEREVYHTGGQQGTSTILYLRPDQQFAFVWLTNLEGVETRLPIARQIFQLVEKKTAPAR